VFLRDMFGEYAGEMQEYFKTLSELFQPAYMRGELDYICESSAALFDKIPNVINKKLPLFPARFEKETDPCRKQTWYALIIHAQLCIYLAKTLSFKAKGLQSEADAMWQQTIDYTNQIEIPTESLFDAKYFIGVVSHTIRGEQQFGSLM